MIIVWDELKRVANLHKHSIDFADIDGGFFLGAVIEPARPSRFKALGGFKALGEFEGRPISVIFQPLGREGLSIISARPASDNERKLLS